MRLMIVGSLSGQISTAGKIAIGRGAKVTHCEDAEQALGALRAGKGADLIMIDVKQNIATFIEQLNAERFAVPVVACGITNDASAAVRAIKAGAKEYVPLPPDAELIAAVLEAVAGENNTAMIATDPAMKAVTQMADKIAPSDATVLITGESGTGKEVMSRYIHQKSKRSRGPFISINCAAIPENLLESELFGHEKGAFTGAVARRIGKFEEANGGTLLLDEVSEMHPSLQAKLLRAIQERIIDRIGGKEPVKIDIRLIATSNRDMEEAVRAGQFREDLYFRLNVVNLELPGLRERPSDIPALAQMFANKYSEQNGIAVKSLSPEAIDKLKKHHWQGNVRELENTMHRAILISQEPQIEAAAIMLAGQKTSSIAETATQTAHAVIEKVAVGDNKPAGGLVGRTVSDVEQELILNTLNQCLGNRTHAANILGISIRTLRNKLKQYGDAGIDIPE
jgi:DNA-binding NtrC family response regulator